MADCDWFTGEDVVVELGKLGKSGAGKDLVIQVFNKGLLKVRLGLVEEVGVHRRGLLALGVRV